MAVLFGIGLLFMCECILRLFGWGIPKDTGDPFVGFSGIHPLFVLNEKGDRYEIPKSRRAFFRPESFAAKKGENEFRIFCVGGSTVQGRPYAIETSFTTWLELSLKAADPSREWEVVNCGGVSYASYRLVPIMQELLDHGPDMFIVYTGHNEFLEERTYAGIKYTSGWIKRLYAGLSNLRLYGLMQQLSGVSDEIATEAEREPTTLRSEVDALLDYRGGLEKYHRDDEWQRGVIAHFEHNLRRMIQIARRARVPLVLANPVCNLRDSPPFKVEHDHGLTAQQLAQFEKLWEDAKAMKWERIEEKSRLVKQVLAIDDRFANAHFLLARCYEDMHQLDDAKAAYIRAKDEDICPLRMLESMNEIVLSVARQTGTKLVDVRKLFEAKAENGIPGDGWLIDHVHPRIEGHQLIAEAFFDLLTAQGIVEIPPEYEQRKKELFDNRMKTLDPGYFPQSVERLNGLRRWAQGRAGQIDVDQDE